MSEPQQSVEKGSSYLVECKATDMPGVWLYWDGPYVSEQEAIVAMDRTSQNNPSNKFRVRPISQQENK